MQIFEISDAMGIKSCLPKDIDMSNMVEVTAIGDYWRKYLDVKTGKLHDGAVYFAQMLN